MATKTFIGRQIDWQGIALPIVLLLTGLIMVGGDFLGILSLDRIQNYWPIALIVIGLTDLIDESKPVVLSQEQHVRHQ